MPRLSFGQYKSLNAVMVLCGLAAAVYVFGGWTRAWTEDQRSLQLDTDGVNTLRILARNGRVRVSPAEPRSPGIGVEMKIKAGGSTPEEAQACLEALKVSHPLTDGTLTLSTGINGARKRHWSAEVSYDVFVDPSLGLDVQTRNGSIEVNGLHGRTKLQARNAKIRVSDHSGPLAVVTRNGAIELQTRGHEVEAQARNGHIRARLQSGGALQGTIRTRNGHVTLSLADGSSTELHLRTRNGRIRNSLGVEVKRQGSRRSATVGDGDGVLQIETRSGHITLQPDE